MPTELPNAFSGGDVSPLPIEERVHRELLRARKSPEGLSPNLMATLATMRDLLGDGDPLVAFQRLQHRILETLELDDDVTGIEAAAYSLGLGSAGRTHLDRLNDFGRDHGYEARQARRHSDKGLRQLARLITSNWIVHTVPTLEVFLAQQANGSFAVTLRATRQHFVDMRELTIHDVRDHGDGAPQRTQRAVELAIEERPSRPGPPARAAHVVTTLAQPFVLPAPEPGEPSHLRFEWRGEVWPRFVFNLIGRTDAEPCITSQTLGAVMQVSLELLE